ncbi:MAG TPA: MFS transporter [Gaiellaceae bacterium]|jgi:DHA3 family tetracycline resistance protein-like MFS transporter|nr:MFS transporter [Gaiellaceae bacterium]
MSHLAAPRSTSPIRRRLRRPAIFEPLAVRDFGLLWAGDSVSLVGDGVFTVAIAWQVYALSNAPTALAIVGVARVVPMVGFVLFSGALADRLDRRRLLIVGAALPGAAVAVLAALALSGGLQLWQIWAISAVVGLGRAISGPAAGAIVPELVPAHLLVRANSLEQLMRPLAMTLVGPALGGVLIAAVGTGSAFAFDAASFGVGVLALSAIRPRPRVRDGEPSSLYADLREGFAFVRRHTWIWGTLGVATVWVLVIVGPFEVLVPFMLKNELGAGPHEFGLVYAAGGIGAIVAALGMGNLGLPRRNVTVMLLGWGIGCAAVIGIGLASSSWQAGVAMGVSESLFTVGEIIWITLLQALVPGELLGRVRSIDWLLSVGLLPVGYALTGPVAAAFGARETLVAAGALSTLLVVATLLLPRMREPEGRLT